MCLPFYGTSRNVFTICRTDFSAEKQCHLHARKNPRLFISIVILFGNKNDLPCDPLYSWPDISGQPFRPQSMSHYGVICRQSRADCSWFLWQPHPRYCYCCCWYRHPRALHLHGHCRIRRQRQRFLGRAPRTPTRHLLRSAREQWYLSEQREINLDHQDLHTQGTSSQGLSAFGKMSQSPSIVCIIRVSWAGVVRSPNKWTYYIVIQWGHPRRNTTNWPLEKFYWSTDMPRRRVGGTVSQLSSTISTGSFAKIPHDGKIELDVRMYTLSEICIISIRYSGEC